MSALPEWTPGNCGAGKRIWFVARGDGAEFDRVPVELRYHCGANGELVRYGSYAGAQRAVDKLNAAERAAAAAQAPDTVIQFDPGTGELREYTRKEIAEVIDVYARTFPEGSIDRGVYQRKMLEVVRGEGEWLWLKENSEPMRALLAAELDSSQAMP